METNENARDCIVVKWTQILNDSVIDDPLGDLYFVDIDKISDGDVCLKLIKKKFFIFVIKSS